VITKKQKEILDFITDYKAKKGYAPSLDEIRIKMKLASLSTAHYHVSRLCDEGLLIKEDNKPRAIDFTKPDESVRVPIIGVISESEFVEMRKYKDDHISLSSNQFKEKGKYFGLRILGNALEKFGIINGDVILVREGDNPEPGQLFVDIINEDLISIKKCEKKDFKISTGESKQLALPMFCGDLRKKGIIVKVIRDLEKNAEDRTLAFKKKVFLDSIRSKNPNSKNKYKRVALSPIRYAGGKSLAVGYVIELLPDNIKRVISPFFGGGSVEIALSKKLGLEVIGFDIFDILVNYWKFQIENPKLLYEKLKELKPDKETFEKIRLILRDVWNKKISLDPLTLAVYFVYNFNLSYGPGFMGWASKIYLNNKRYQRMIEYIRDFEAGDLKVECDDFREVIPKYPNDFLYCDPPYYIGKDSKMFKGIYPMRNIPVHHVGFPHEELRDLLANHKGGFILSYNDCPTIRNYYKNYEQYFPSWQYTMGQGETRIGFNRKNKGSNHIKDSHEIIIFCPPKI